MRLIVGRTVADHVGDVAAMVGAVELAAIPAQGRRNSPDQLLPRPAGLQRYHHVRERCGRRMTVHHAFEVELSRVVGLGLGPPHLVPAEDQPQPARDFDAFLRRRAADRIGLRTALVIDRDVVGANGVATPVEHRRHPIGGAIELVHAGAVA